MMASSIAIPRMMIFSFLTMVPMFDQTIKEAAKFLYTQQIYVFMSDLKYSMIKSLEIVIVGCNLMIAAILFMISYKRNGGKGYMYELIQVSENCYYIQSPAKIGLVKVGDTDVCLIDSGNDKDAGRKVRQLLDKNKWHLTAIYNTHSNADHIGGNKYLQGQTGCKIYAPGIECAFTRHTILEPAFLYGGYPCKDLQHKFLMAQESNADHLTKEVLPEGFEMIDLPGHFFDMVGFRTPDDVVYLADCLSSQETLDKYQIGFIYDIASYIKTLEMVKSLNAQIFVPAHAAATENIAPLAQYNIDKVFEIAEKIVEICREPLCFENILQKLFADYGLAMNFEQYVLVGSTVRSYLAWLKDTGKIVAQFENNMLLWKRI